MIPERIVIDTNVCLDLFHFRDPRWDRLLDALRAGHVEALTRDDCRNEWRIVLGYAHLGIAPEDRPRIEAQFDMLIRPFHGELGDAVAVLPVCRDPDDQKFLELARDAGARTLLTKDKALLKLARRTRKAGLFAIMAPDAWLRERPELGA
ncbi:MAG: PIN domain-containing protein [Burkholderiaceae bacterium]